MALLLGLLWLLLAVCLSPVSTRTLSVDFVVGSSAPAALVFSA